MCQLKHTVGKRLVKVVESLPDYAAVPLVVLQQHN